MTENKKPTGDEPTGKRKGRRTLTLKQTRLVQQIPKSTNLSEAGQRAGFATRQATYRAMNSIRRTAPEELARLRITPRKVLAKLAEMMDCTRTQLIVSEGLVQQEVEVKDNDIRFRARVHMAKLLGLEAPQQVELEVKHSYEMDFRNAKEEDLDKFLKFCAAFGRRLPVGTGMEVQAEPIDVVTG